MRAALLFLEDQLVIPGTDFDPVAGLELAFEQAHRKRVANLTRLLFNC